MSNPAQSATLRRTLLAHRLAAAAGWVVPVLLRATSGTAVFASGPVVIRLAEPGRGPLTSSDQDTLARHLVGRGASVAQPVDFPAAWAGPLEAGGSLGGDELGLWRRVDTDGVVTPARLAGALSALHRVDPATLPVALGGFGVTFDRLNDQLAGLQHYPLLATGARWLGRFLSTAARIVSEPSAPSVLLHGDVNRGNVLAGPDRIVLCDLESVMTGPALWDLAAPASDRLLRRTPWCDPVALLDAYGATSGRPWSTLVRLRATDSVLFRITEHAAGSPAGDAAPALLAALLAELSGGL